MSKSRPGDIFHPGDLLNNTYRIQSILGRGGTSEVYQARSEISGRVVALKALRSEFSTNEDFLVLMTREEEIRDVRHDAVVRYYDNQRMPDGVVYLVMDFVDGPALDLKLASGGMSAEDLLVIGARVCEGLIAAHEGNIVHRDLSPDNIILRNGNPAEAVIIDFGIAKDTNPGAETIVGNEFAGKYAYAAPEQLSGHTDPRSDIYSLGALLLATFRGAKPDIGNNPMEVLQKKAEPQNVEGVPEPLKSLIAKMCDPIPEKRFQSSQEALAAFQAALGQAAPSAPTPNDDATVIRPVAAKPAEKPKPVEPQEPARNEPAKKKSGMLVPVIAAAVVAVAGIGGFLGGAFDGLLAPALPIASPYVLTIERPDGLAPHATGNVPSSETEATLRQVIDSTGGTAELSLASGDISETWGPDMIALYQKLAQLDEYRISISDNSIDITGMTRDRDLRDRALEAVTTALPAAYSGTADIILGPRFLPAQDLQSVLQESADCGPLTLLDPPLAGYGLTDRIIVQGKLAETASRIALFDALAKIGGDRSVTIDAEVFSPGLCQIEAALPRVPAGGFDVSFGFGDRPDENPSGRYFVGENPVIDVTIPADVTEGFLWVSVLDVSGNVFHLLPNLNRPDNRIATLRNGATGAAMVRVAYSVAEGADPSKIAFLVDDSTLGKSKVIALYSDTPLFEQVRPTTESAASYVDALRTARDTGGFKIRTLDSGILTTASK